MSQRHTARLAALEDRARFDEDGGLPVVVLESRDPADREVIVIGYPAMPAARAVARELEADGYTVYRP